MAQAIASGLGRGLPVAARSRGCGFMCSLGRPKATAPAQASALLAWAGTTSARTPAALRPSWGVPRTMVMHGGGSGGGGGRGLVRAASGGPDGGGASGHKGLWGLYLDLLDSYPLLTRCITCGVLNGLGDIFCQLFVEQQPFSAARCAKFSAIGLLYIGPILALWYGFLGSTVSGVLASVAWDQLVFAPLFIASIMGVMCTVEGNAHLIVPKIKQDLPEAVKVNWVLWVPFQYFNFKFVPLNLRTLAVNVVALLWNVYMSYSGHKHVEPEAAA